jgi:hypothetical protein
MEFQKALYRIEGPRNMYVLQKIEIYLVHDHNNFSNIKLTRENNKDL